MIAGIADIAVIGKAKRGFTAKDAEDAKDRDIGPSGHRDVRKSRKQKKTADAQVILIKS